MLIIEGPDLAGKTTLAKKLVEKSPDPLVYKHYSRLPDNFHRYWDYLPDIRPVHVLDRFFMSEPVYAQVRGDQTPMKPRWLVPLQREVMSAGGITVLMTLEPELIEQRWRPDEMYPIEKVFMANELFIEIARTGSLGPFEFHVDFHFHATPDTMYVSDDFVLGVLNHHSLICNRAAYMKGTREYAVPVRQEA